MRHTDNLRVYVYVRACVPVPGACSVRSWWTTALVTSTTGSESSRGSTSARLYASDAAVSRTCTSVARRPCTAACTSAGRGPVSVPAYVRPRSVRNTLHA
jgi:hypothetical protein